MEKTYPRVLIRKRNGKWQICCRYADGIDAVLADGYMYRFDARNEAYRKLGKPVRFTQTIRKN